MRYVDAQTGALAAQSMTSRALGAFFETCDVLLTPTVACATPAVGSKLNLLQTDVTLDEWFRPVMQAVPYTPLCNFTGVPAISLSESVANFAPCLRRSSRMAR